MGGCEGPSVKRRRSEEDAEIEGHFKIMKKVLTYSISELRKKLAMAESRCERLSNHSIDSVRNFRNIILKVTGYDIKVLMFIK